MSEKTIDSLPGGDANLLLCSAKYILWGAIAGLVAGIGTLFVLAMFFGELVGISSTACVAVRCTLTLLLSQPAGISGMVVGATVGALAGGVVCYLHHRAHPM